MSRPRRPSMIDRHEHDEKKNVIPMANYFSHISPADLEEIMEWLQDHEYLSVKGEKFKTNFWSLFIKKRGQP
jgi:hypothetical protein